MLSEQNTLTGKNKERELKKRQKSLARSNSYAKDFLVTEAQPAYSELLPPQPF